MNEIYKILEKYWNENKLVLGSYFDSPLEEKSLESFKDIILYLIENYNKKDLLIENNKALEEKYFETGILPDDLGPLLLMFANTSNTLYVWMYHTTHKQPQDFTDKYSELLNLMVNKLRNY